MIAQNTRESAMRREEFHDELRRWLDDSFDTTVGDADGFGGEAWLWVRHGGSHFYLNADSDRSGVRRYMRLVEAEAGNPTWTMLEPEGRIRERVAVGPSREIIQGFEFYHHLPTR